jgi:hypothetical protein
MRCIEFLRLFFSEFQILESEFRFLDVSTAEFEKKIQPESSESKTESEFRFQWGSQKSEPKIGIPNLVPSGVSSTLVFTKWFDDGTGVLTFVVKLKCIVLHTNVKFSEKLVPRTLAQNVRDYRQQILLTSFDFVQLT